VIKLLQIDKKSIPNYRGICELCVARRAVCSVFVAICQPSTVNHQS